MGTHPIKYRGSKHDRETRRAEKRVEKAERKAERHLGHNVADDPTAPAGVTYLGPNPSPLGQVATNVQVRR